MRGFLIESEVWQSAPILGAGECQIYRQSTSLPRRDRGFVFCGTRSDQLAVVETFRVIARNRFTGSDPDMAVATPATLGGRELHALIGITKTGLAGAVLSSERNRLLLLAARETNPSEAEA